MNGQLSRGAGSFPGVVKIRLRFGQVSSLFLLFSPANPPAALRFINKHNSTLAVASSHCHGLYLCPRSSNARRRRGIAWHRSPAADSTVCSWGVQRELLGTTRNWPFFVGSVVPQVVMSQGHRRDAANLRARRELALGSPSQVEMGRKRRISIFLGLFQEEHLSRGFHRFLRWCSGFGCPVG